MSKRNKVQMKRGSTMMRYYETTIECGKVQQGNVEVGIEQW